MNRKTFIESHGATCKNWYWSWSFVNEEEKLVIFGAWDINMNGDAELILKDEWQAKSIHKAAYKQARDHIRLVEEEGYQLKTFPMQFSDEKQDEDGNGPAKIKGFTPVLSQRTLQKVGQDWFAVPIASQEKVARVCWNTNGWRKPSGEAGKSRNPDAYEFQNGYGHEEWLLDTTKRIAGYHYAYIQPIGSHRDLYLGMTFNIAFYSINSETHQRWWVGTIKNIQIVGGEESRRVFDIYKKRGWYDEMISQLESVGADSDAFRTFSTPETFSALKFKIEDLELLDEPLEFSPSDPAVRSDYYNLKNKIQEPTLYGTDQFEFIAGHNKKKGNSVSTYQEHKVEIDLVHNQIQDALYDQLTEAYGKNHVGTENPTGKGTRIDAVVRHTDKYSFYEIKTSQSIRQCVRDAVGQLLEYAHFGNDVSIKELVIVSPNKITGECLSYLSSIREKYGIPLVYRQFDLEAMQLLEPTQQ